MYRSVTWHGTDKGMSVDVNIEAVCLRAETDNLIRDDLGIQFMEKYVKILPGISWFMAFVPSFHRAKGSRKKCIHVFQFKLVMVLTIPISNQFS